MRSRQTRFWGPLLAAAVILGCGEPPTEPSRESVSGEPQLSIEDAVHNEGNPHFYWMPPLVSNPSHAGTFQGGLAPVVEICEWDGAGCVLPLVAEFTTTTGPGSETVRTVPEDELYIVNWHTGQVELDASRSYRIVAKVDGHELGHADVDVVDNGRQLRNVDTGEYIALIDGGTLPIKFRIEDGALPNEITIDASALSAPTVDVRGANGRIGLFSVTEVIVIPNEPGTYTIADRSGGNPIPFSITAAGLVDFDPSHDPIFLGRGSTSLTVVGYRYVVDATALTAPHVLLGGIGTFPNAEPFAVTELPGSKNVQELGGGLAFYQLSADGSITYATDVEPYLDGLGSTTLGVVGYPYTVDASGLSVSSIVLGAIGSFPTANPMDVRGLPGLKVLIDPSGGTLLYQVVAADGTIALSPESDQVADGSGTTTLTLVGVEFHVDATLMSVSSFVLGGLASVSTASMHSFRLIPGLKIFQSSALNFPFTVDNVGLLDYDSALDGRVSGRGTNTLTILF